jgi:hypothetical protein
MVHNLHVHVQDIVVYQETLHNVSAPDNVLTKLVYRTSLTKVTCPLNVLLILEVVHISCFTKVRSLEDKL